MVFMRRRTTLLTIVGPYAGRRPETTNLGVVGSNPSRRAICVQKCEHLAWLDLRPLLQEVPEGVRSVVRQRGPAAVAAGHGRHARRRVVVGLEFDFDTLEPLVGLEDDTLFDAIEEATAAHLILEVPGKRARLSISHTPSCETRVVRVVLLGPATPIAPSCSRSTRTRRVTNPRQRHPGRTASTRLTIRRLTSSASSNTLCARRRSAPTAWHSIKRATSTNRLSTFSPRARGWTGVGASRCCSDSRGPGAPSGLNDAAREACLRAVSTARDLGDPELFATAVLELLWFHPATPFVIRSTTKVTEDTKQLLSLLDEAYEQLDGCSDALQAAVCAHMSLVTDDLERKATLADAAVTHAERSGSEKALALALDAQLGAQFDPRNPPSELRIAAERIGELATVGGDVERQAFAAAVAGAVRARGGGA